MCKIFNLAKYLPKEYFEIAEQSDSGIMGYIRMGLGMWGMAATESGVEEGFIKYKFPNFVPEEAMAELLFEESTKKLKWVQYEPLGIAVYLENLFDESNFIYIYIYIYIYICIYIYI